MNQFEHEKWSEPPLPPKKDTGPSPLAYRIADALLQFWKIGYFSAFCDEVDFNDVSREDVAKRIESVLGGGA